MHVVYEQHLDLYKCYTQYVEAFLTKYFLM